MLAVALIALFSGLALLHVYWAFGKRTALQGTIPTERGRPLFEPGPVACLAVAAALAAAAVVAGMRAGLFLRGMPSWISQVGIWVIALVFAARAVGDFRYVGFFKRVRGSLFARRDSRLYSPLCVVIALLAAGLAVSSSGPVGPLPGGALDGEAPSAPPGDWSFTDAHSTVQLEVRPDDPYSVNVWCVAAAGSLYIGAGRGASSIWARALLDDPRARVRIGTVLFDVVATHISDDAEIQVFLEALAKKYESSEAQLSDFQSEANEAPAAILFRMGTASD